jgi:hypothetical protein
MNWRKWLDDFVLAGKGILLATKEKRFWYGFVPSFIFFGLLMNLLSSGTSKFNLMFSLGFPAALKILGESFLNIFGFNKIFCEWLSIFFISLLQATLIGLIVLLWHKKRKENTENLGKAGIVTGLIALGAGCPTCGATLLAPLFGTIFSSGGIVIAGALSIVITWLAIIIAIFSLKRLGLETYVIITNEKYLKKKGEKCKKSSASSA